MKKIRNMFLLLVALMPTVVQAADLEYIACGNAEGIPAPVPQLTSICYTLLIIATPIILIIFSIVALIKAITGGDADAIKKAKNKVVKKFIAAAIVFFVAGIVQFVVSKASTNDSDKNSAVDCINCMLYNEGCAPSTSDNDAYKATGSPSNSSSSTQSTSNSSSSQTSNNNSSNSSSKGTKTIFVGDSRTVGICQYNNSTLNVGKCRDYLTVSQLGKGYTWFEQTAISNVNTLLNQNSGTKFNIVILLGVNDVSNTTTAAENAASKYIEKIKKQANGDWKNHNIIFTSVTKLGATSTGGSWPITQASIDHFNSQMKSKINSLGLSNVSYCDINSGLDLSGKIASDNIHYTSDGYTAVYNQVVKKCL